MSLDNFLEYKEFYFSSQTKRWDKLMEAVPVLAHCNNGQLDVICDLLKQSFKAGFLEGAKKHPNRKNEKIWVAYFKENAKSLNDYA